MQGGGVNNNSNIFTSFTRKIMSLFQYKSINIHLYKIICCFKIYLNISLFYSVFHS